MKLYYTNQKYYPLSFAIKGDQSLIRALQSTPFQNPGRFPERDGRTREEDRRAKILVFNIGYYYQFYQYQYISAWNTIILPVLEGMAHYAGQNLTPVEGFDLRPRLNLPFGQKKAYCGVLVSFRQFFGNLSNFSSNLNNFE